MPPISIRRSRPGWPPSLPYAFHPHFDILAQSGRTLLRVDHRRSNPVRRVQECRRTRSCNSRLSRSSQRRSKAFRVDQIRYRHSRKGRPRETSVRVTTLVSVRYPAAPQRSMDRTAEQSRRQNAAVTRRWFSPESLPSPVHRSLNRSALVLRLATENDAQGEDFRCRRDRQEPAALAHVLCNTSQTAKPHRRKVFPHYHR